MAPEITDTMTPDPVAPTAVGSGKRNSNCAQPTDIQTASPSLPVNLDSDVTVVASIGESDGNLDYVELAEKSTTSPFQPKTDLFPTRALIWVHFKTVRYFSQPIFILFSYKKMHNTI